MVVFRPRRIVKASGSNRTERTALKNLLSQADRILETSPTLPENRTGACRKLLKTALASTDDLIKHSATPAALMGSKGGSVTAKRHGTNTTARWQHGARLKAGADRAKNLTNP